MGEITKNCGQEVIFCPQFSLLYMVVDDIIYIN